MDSRIHVECLVIKAVVKNLGFSIFQTLSSGTIQSWDAVALREEKVVDDGRMGLQYMLCTLDHARL